MRPVVAIGLLALAACRHGSDSAQGPTPRTVMTEQALVAMVADTASPRGRIYRPAEVSKPAFVVAGNPVPRWPREDGCAIVYFVVGSEGRYEQGTGLAAPGSNAALATVVLRYLPRWRFVPALGPDQQPVRQVTQLRIVKRGNGAAVAMAPEGVGEPCPFPAV